MEGYLRSFLISNTRWRVSRLDPFVPRRKPPARIEQEVGWGPERGLDGAENRTTSWYNRDSNHDSSPSSSYHFHYTDYDIPAHSTFIRIRLSNFGISTFRDYPILISLSRSFVIPTNRDETTIFCPPPTFISSTGSRISGFRLFVIMSF